MTKIVSFPQEKFVLEYAKSLLELEEEYKKPMFRELRLVLEYMNDELIQFLKHPKIKASEKKKVFATVYYDTKRICQITLYFLYLLIDQHHIFYLKDILDAYQKEKYKQEGIVEVEVVSVDVLSKQDQEKIITKMEKLLHQKVLLKQTIDSTILGGFVVKYDHKVIDASLLNKQEALKKYLEK